MASFSESGLATSFRVGKVFGLRVVVGLSKLGLRVLTEKRRRVGRGVGAKSLSTSST